MSQAKLIHNHLKAGNLKAEGVPIKSELVTRNGKTFSRYTMSR